MVIKGKANPGIIVLGIDEEKSDKQTLKIWAKSINSFKSYEDSNSFKNHDPCRYGHPCAPQRQQNLWRFVGPFLINSVHKISHFFAFFQKCQQNVGFSLQYDTSLLILQVFSIGPCWNVILNWKKGRKYEILCTEWMRISPKARHTHFDGVAERTHPSAAGIVMLWKT